uniref:Uncharacterized protein n=1 Tax=Arundo donax TaxID=35708 RepID=A0A0A9C9B2_ARUDO
MQSFNMNLLTVQFIYRINYCLPASVVQCGA